MLNKTEVSKPETLKSQGIETLPALFEFGSKKWGEKVALKKHHSWGYQSITYGELTRLLSFVGMGLIREELSNGDRVALIADNSPEWAVLYGAVVSSGGIIVPLDTSLNENEIRHLLMHSGAKFLVTTPKIYEDSLEGMQKEDIKIILIEEKEKESGETSLNLGKIMARGKEAINNGESDFFQRKAEVKGGDTAAICYTSGVTGTPKGSVLLHRNIIANLESIRLRIPITFKDNFLCILPMYHTFATTCTMLTPFANGSTVVFGRSLKPNLILEDIKKEQISILVGVPLLFEHLMEFIKVRAGGRKEAKGIFARFIGQVKSAFSRVIGGGGEKSRPSPLKGLETLKFCISGAAALRPDVEKTLVEAGVPLLQGYGLTECSPVVSVNPPGKSKFGTVGTALTNVEVMTEDSNEEGVGEIVVAGPNVMKEYFRNPEATGRILRNEKLYTGDLGKIDEEGYITVLGRVKSVIVTAGGKNVYPEEIELIIDRSPYVLESAVVEVKDRRGNIRPGAIIVPDYDEFDLAANIEKPLTEEKIKEVLSARIEEICSELPEYKKIYDFQLRGEELPRTATNKLKRHMITWIEEE